jgi:methylmalonyl-CoA mutase N-terminal domain/subunit
MERKIQEHMERIRSMGGIVRCVEQGVVQSEVAAMAYAQQRRLEAGEEVKVGLNRYMDDEGEGAAKPEIYRQDPAELEAQLERTARVRRERDAAEAEQALAEVRRAAEGQENLMPVLKAAVRAYCTVGEISGALQGVFGEFEEPKVI